MTEPDLPPYKSNIDVEKAELQSGYPSELAKFNELIE